VLGRTLNPKKPRDRFDIIEQPTQPSAQNPLRSGKHPSFREPSVEDVSVKTGQHRRHSSERETIRRPTTWDIEEEAVATPRPRVAFAHVPRVIMTARQVKELPLVARAGFILAHIDGTTNVQTIVDISGMDADEVLHVLDQLLVFGVISVT
jgi:hypothetical protein